MDLLTKGLCWLSMALLLASCQISYLTKNAYHQMKLLGSRVGFDEALNSDSLSAEQKAKIRLALEAKDFAQSKLKLKVNKNYSQFVDLKRSHVTYVVSAAPKWELRHHLWSFPIIGKVPYKGFFSDAEAQYEEQGLISKDFDTYRRGVSAYSTLGWFNDPLLSSMLNYSQHELVSLIIHESTHATLYIKSNADFNERLGTFVGDKGTELFYINKEGIDSPTLKLILAENQDQLLFAQFITQELRSLDEYYKSEPAKDESLRLQRLKEIQNRFVQQLKPQLITHRFHWFENAKLNNARLLVFKTYTEDLSDFDELYRLSNSNMSNFLDHIKSLEKSKDPAQDLKQLIQQLKKL